VFIDCRSEMEYMFVGHPDRRDDGALVRRRDWELNPALRGPGEAPRRAPTSRSVPVVLICRSGNRTIEAGEALERSGFKRVINVLHGFEGELDENHHRNARSGWRVDGLPWEQY
jgi:rhodanese-related sulfurtransferase